MELSKEITAPLESSLGWASSGTQRCIHRFGTSEIKWNFFKWHSEMKEGEGEGGERVKNLVGRGKANMRYQGTSRPLHIVVINSETKKMPQD